MKTLLCLAAVLVVLTVSVPLSFSGPRKTAPRKPPAAPAAAEREPAAVHRRVAASLEHRVERVTAYSDRALVTRAARASLKPGFQWVRFAGLSQAVHPDSVQVKLTGMPGGRIAQVLMEESYERVALKPELEAKVAELRDLYGRLLDLGQRETLLGDKITFLEALTFDSPFPKTTTHEYHPFQAKADTLGAAMEATHRALAEASGRKRDLEEEIREVERRIELRRKEIETASTVSDRRWVRHLYLLVEAPKGGNGELEVAYQLGGASWRPVYDVRADLDRGKGEATITLVTAGLVEQHTGEDWKQVRLTLSTLDPAPLYLPRLTRWTLAEQRSEAYEPSGDGMRRKGAPKAKAMELGRGGGGAPPAPPMAGQPEAAPADLEEQAESAAFDDSTLEDAAPARKPEGKLGRANVAAPKPVRTPGAGGRFPLFRLEDRFQPLKHLGAAVASLDSAVEQARRVDATGGAPEPARYDDPELPAVAARGRLIELESPFVVDVAHDADPYKIPLTSQLLRGELTYFSVPKRDPAVYLRATTRNTTPLPLLGGDAQIFMDGDLVSRTELETVDEGGFFTVDLGADRNVEVKRVVDRKSRKEGLLNKEQVTDVEVRIEVANRHGFPISLELKDQVPVSPDERIRVTLRETTPRIKADDDGMLEWKAKVAAGKKSTFVFKYRVAHPENFLVSELN